MPNIYSPPGTIQFYNTNFVSHILHYQEDPPDINNTNSTLGLYSNITAFDASNVTFPMTGDYIINWHTGAYSGVSGNRAYYRFLCTTSSLQTTLNGGISNSATNILVNSTSGWPTSGFFKVDNEEIQYSTISGNTLQSCLRGRNGTSAVSHSNGAFTQYAKFVGDNSTHLFMALNNTSYNASFMRRINIPLAGTWSLQPQWKPDFSGGGGIKVDQDSTYHTWALMVGGINPLDAVNQQLTQFVNSSYTLMTNVDNAANWGTQTTTSIVNNTNNTAANTSAVSVLSGQVNDLSVSVSNLSESVNGLTSTAVTSGGIRIKP